MINKRSAILVARQSRTQKTERNDKNRSKENKMVKGGSVQEYMDASQASATKRAYASDLRHFLARGGKLWLARNAKRGRSFPPLRSGRIKLPDDGNLLLYVA